MSLEVPKNHGFLELPIFKEENEWDEKSPKHKKINKTYVKSRLLLNL
jgi:hypothetical protein